MGDVRTMERYGNRERSIAQVIGVACDDGHRFAKPQRDMIRLLRGLGVAGDAHCGERVQHLSRVKQAPLSPNLRQVHLIHAELFDELKAARFTLQPGKLGENVTTRGLDLLRLAEGTRLQLGGQAVVEVTGLRNPCWQIDRHIGRGAMAATLSRDPDGSLIRKAGVMAIVIAGGEVRPRDEIAIVALSAIQKPLRPV
jgi:hypothetical protein